MSEPCRRASATKELLRAIIPEVKNQAKCIIVYGSQSKNSTKSPAEDSDLDFVVVFKGDANISLISKTIEGVFADSKAPYDYGWFDEVHLRNLVEEGIDWYLHTNIFIHGEALYADEEFITEIIAKLKATDPFKSFINTVDRRVKSQEDLKQMVVRNLQRLLTDYIVCQYYAKHGRIPKFETLIDIVRRPEGLFSDEAKLLFEQLESVRKTHEKEGRTISFETLHQIEIGVYRLIAEYLDTLRRAPPHEGTYPSPAPMEGACYWGALQTKTPSSWRPTSTTTAVSSTNNWLPSYSRKGYSRHSLIRR